MAVVSGTGLGRPLKVAGAPVAGTSEVQTITFGSGITSGTFRLSFMGSVTAAITWSSTNNTLRDNVDAALEALGTIGTGNVATAVGTMTAGIGTLTVTFGGALALQAVDLIAVHTNALVTGTLVVTETTPGVTVTGLGALKGALLIDTDKPNLYMNTSATVGIPVWTQIQDIT